MPARVSLMPDDLQTWIRDELFNKVPVAICVVDDEYRVVQANLRFRWQWDGRTGHR